MAIKKKDDEEAENTPEAFTREAAEELFGELFSKSFNGAFTSKMKDFETRFSKQFDGKLGELIATLKPAEDEGEPKGKGGKGAAELPPEVQKRLKASEDVNAALKKQLDELAAERENERKARESAEQETAVTAAMRKLGADEMGAESAYALLLKQGRVGRTEAGKVFIRVKGKTGDLEHDDVEKGVGEWFKGDGKRFIPPVNAGGSGNAPRGGGNGAAGGKTKYNDHDLAASLMGAFAAEGGVKTGG